ncbi:unnamed protein product, partial [Darwinula stevensoni]
FPYDLRPPLAKNFILSLQSLETAGVGKTSIILSLVSEEFPEFVPAKSEEITIPPEVTPEKVPTHIIDYSRQDQTLNELAGEIQRADAICIIYAVDDPESFSAITAKWIPFIRKVLNYDEEEENVLHKPIILAGNKVDLIEESSMDDVVPLMSMYPEIETCVFCSAKTLRNISELFYYAQKSVLHPTLPLYVTEERELSDNCKAALTRIFKICDQDNDGLMSDEELMEFQKRCFSTPLAPEALEEVKQAVRKAVPDAISNNSLTLKGFLVLHKMFIQRGYHETTWTVLRKFGYTDSLSLSQDYLHPKLKVPSGSRMELSPVGIQFLTNLFHKYDRDRDLALCPVELNDLFSTCPGGNIPWGPQVFYAVSTNDKGWMTLQGFLSMWVMATFIDIQKTMEYLAYFGYVISDTEDQTSAVTVLREKDQLQGSRSTYLCHVIGLRGVGKTTLCQGLIGRKLKDVNNLSEENVPTYTTNKVMVYGHERYLILREVNVMSVSDALLPSQLNCDVACLAYDVSNPSSFEAIAKLYLKYLSESSVPCMVVACKGDKPSVSQEYLVQPEDFCHTHRLPHLAKWSGTLEGDAARAIYTKLATMATYPFFRRYGLTQGSSSSWVQLGLGISSAAALACLLFLLYRSRRVS